ncbi:hypothetical protein GOBAR_DD09831 [Gossypium barbadense]|nr:hypothetical protein GOBAR_DD09831 [Gossypium barbadense]
MDSMEDSFCGIDGLVTGITFSADSVKKKIILKLKDRNAPHQGASSSVANSPSSTAARQCQQQEAGGKLIRSILSSNETGQNQSSTAVQAQQKTETMSLDNVKRPLRPTNSRLGLNGHVSNDIAAFECDFDTKSVSNEKFIKKALHGSGSGSEKHEKRTRNKDRPDHGVWSPLHCSDVRKASEELLTPSVLQSAQASRNPNEDSVNALPGENVNYKDASV